MSRHYALKSFLRHAPNALLARYFHDRGHLLDLDIAALPESQIGPIFDAWNPLSEAVHVQTDSDFRLIDTLADELGVKALLEEGAFHGEDLEPIFAAMDGCHEIAFWAFLERLQYAEAAERFREADRLPERYWLRRKDVPGVEPLSTLEGCRALDEALSRYLRSSAGRGQRCTVEVYRRAEAVYFFAYPEDYGRTTIEYARGQLERRSHRPAFEIVFRYSPVYGTLDTFCRGTRDTVRELNRVFGRVILDLELLDEPRDERVYNLDRFKRRDVAFVFDPACGIREIAVVLLQLSLPGKRRGRITVECDANRDPRAIYDVLESELTAASQLHPYADMHVTKVGLRVEFAQDGRRGRRSRTFSLRYPNACNLRHDGRDILLRDLLVLSGIEPLPPSRLTAA